MADLFTVEEAPIPVAATKACECCAKARAGIWGTYHATCRGCRARSVARSLAAFDALDPAGTGDKEPIRELTARVLRDMPLKAARQAVMDWWAIDHRKDADGSR